MILIRSIRDKVSGFVEPFNIDILKKRILFRDARKNNKQYVKTMSRDFE